MTAINYNAPARLWKDMLGDTAPGKLAHLYQQEVDFGTLRSCVDAFDAKPNCQKGLYSIQTDAFGQFAKDDVVSTGYRGAPKLIPVGYQFAPADTPSRPFSRLKRRTIGGMSRTHAESAERCVSC